MTPQGLTQWSFRAGWVSTALIGLSLAAFAVISGALKQPARVGLVAGLPFAAMAILVRAWEARRRQRVRDRDAKELLSWIERGEMPRFSLYLRPFWVTGALPTGQKPYESVSPLFAGPDLDFEPLLAEAVASDVPLYGLGQPGEHVGAARILTDDATWPEKIRRLAEGAITIFIIPSSRAGTAKEIDMIIQKGLWAKSVFLMPPGAPGSLAVTWDADRDSLATAGISIPKYSSAGMVFTLDQRGQVRGRADLPRGGAKLKPSALANAIRQAQADAAATPDVDATAIPIGAGLVTSDRCPKCGGTRIRQRPPEERKAMKALTSPRLDDLSADLDRNDERELFSRRATCANCSTVYLSTPPKFPLWTALMALIALIVVALAGWSLGWFGGLVDEILLRFHRQDFSGGILYCGVSLLVLVLLPCVAFVCLSVIWSAIRGKRDSKGPSSISVGGQAEPGAPHPARDIGSESS
jgi:hypothetical protein